MNVTPIAATFSKDPSFWGQDFHPQRILEGKGAQLRDVNGEWYLDWVCGLGANLLGHGVPGFLDAVYGGLEAGVGFSLPSYLEDQVAEKLVCKVGKRIPGFGDVQVRFGATGTDACAAAVRLARAATGRNKILSFGYHGWSSEFVAGTPPAWGVPRNMWQDIQTIPFNDLSVLDEIDRKDVACVILEQPVEDPELGYYDSVRHWCDWNGALLIMDEVVTGLRFALGGACELFGIVPDIVVMGKALGNGLPISLIMAPRELMGWFARNDPVFALSSTTNANNASLAAADYVLGAWDLNGIVGLHRVGNALMAGMKTQGWDVQGHGPRFILKYKSDAEHGYFVSRMRDMGVLANRPFFPCAAHTGDDIQKTLEATGMIKHEVDDLGVEGLEQAMQGKLPKVLFRGR